MTDGDIVYTEEVASLQEMVGELAVLRKLVFERRTQDVAGNAVAAIECAISFDREEVKFRLDENGKPLGVYFKEQKESNQMIEEFMLLAINIVLYFS